MGYIKDVNINNNIHLIEPILYAITSGTANAITAQIVNFDLQSGVVITLKITTPNSVNATLNISSTGPKLIKYNNTAIQAGFLKQNKIYSFVYDGTDNNDTGAWLLIGEINTETSSPMHFLGTVANLPESATVEIEGNIQITASTGDVIIYNSQELIWDGTKWVLFGDESSYALKNEIIRKNIFNAAGQLIYSSAENTPEVLNIPSNLTTPVLTFNSGVPQWKEEYSYTLLTATDTALGGIKIGYTNSNSTDKKYAVQLTNDGKAYVEVNWTDTLYGVAANGGLTITDTPDNQTGKYLLAHFNTLSAAGSSNAGIINNSSKTVLDFGDSFYIPKISYDIHGHITEITDTTLTLPDTSDEKVKQTPTFSETQTQWRRLLLGYSNASNLEVTMNEVTNQAYFYQSLAADAKTGTLRANRYRVLDNVDIEWNSNDESLDFIFI